MPPDPSSTVLIVEDEAIVALDLRELITELGYTVLAVAASADEAIALVTARCPAVVLMDIRIRGTRDGIDTAAVLREQFDVPVIYLTAHADDATLRRARETEPYGYLRKPVEPVDLRTALELAIYKHAQVRQRRERVRLTLAEAQAREGQGAAPAGTGASDEREREQQQQQQQQTELRDRLAALGTLAAGVAHEVNTPLSIVLANASFIQTELGPRPEGDPPGTGTLSAVRAAAAELATAAERITAVIADLRAFARPTTPAVGTADVARVVAWALRTSHHQLVDRAILSTTLEPGLHAAIDETRLGQVIVHLLVNAAQAIAPGHYATNKVNVTAEQRVGEVVIEVRDSGAGIATEVLRRVFEPFFTTRDVGQGEGLGLAVCHGIVCAAGGRMEVESTPGVGSVFRVVLPSLTPTAVPIVATPSPRPPPPAAVATPPRGRLLLVDDDAMLLRSMKRVLRDHDLVCLESAREALALLERGERFDLILSDLMMPDLTGMDFYELLLALDVDQARRVVFITGGAVNAEIADFLAVVPNTWVEKPVAPDALRALIAKHVHALA